MKKPNKSAKIAALLAKGVKPRDVSKKLGVSVSMVYTVRNKMQAEGEPEARVSTPPEPVYIHEPAPLKEVDMVNNPPHYKTGGIEVIDYIEAKRFGYHLGNVIKYISRANRKGGMEDLLKAQWYLNRAIEKGEV